MNGIHPGVLCGRNSGVVTRSEGVVGQAVPVRTPVCCDGEQVSQPPRQPVPLAGDGRRARRGLGLRCLIAHALVDTAPSTRALDEGMTDLVEDHLSEAVIGVVVVGRTEGEVPLPLQRKTPWEWASVHPRSWASRRRRGRGHRRFMTVGGVMGRPALRMGGWCRCVLQARRWRW